MIAALIDKTTGTCLMHVATLVCVVILILLVCYGLWMLREYRLEVLKREQIAEQKRIAIVAYAERLDVFFKQARDYFADSKVVLELVKGYVEFARASNKDATHIAKQTQSVVESQHGELLKVVTQAQENAKMMSDKTEELKEVIPTKTVKELMDSDSKIVKKDKL